ncbi:MAG: nuclear transport factor 2 family protein [Acidimicrobiia bacterium]|nr:nuclear transport factor 2 family protein [Acidimicrobiia bacterium]
MGDHPHAARYREMMAAASQGDMSGFGEVVSDDVEWWEIGSSEPVRGKAALMARMEGWAEYNITADLHDVVANDDHLIVLLNAHASKGDDTLDYRVAEIYHINSSGQVTQRWAFSDDTAAIADFFS